MRYTPVEDKKGNVVGLVSNRRLLDYYIQLKEASSDENMLVKDIMIKDPICVSPETSIKEAMELMRKHKIGCLPVVSKNDLVGVVTEMDFFRITSSLLDRIA